jgi:hypothetical protein
VKLDAKVVEQVSKLVIDNDVTVALKAQEILSRIGPAALPFVWANYRNTRDDQLQEISRKIFSDMSTERIKDELIQRLIGEDRLKSEMAMTLLQERILVEDKKPSPDQKMIAALLGHVRTYGRENTNLRVIALLLLLPKDVVIRHLLPILQGEHQEWLIQIFLLLGLDGGQVAEVLRNILRSQDPTTSHQLRQEVAAVMGFLGLEVDVSEYATTLSEYSYLLELKQAGPITRDPQKLQQQREGLEIALRALGGLLAGGKWNSERLLDLLRRSEEGSPTYELYSVLLGKQFSGQIEQLELDIRNTREEHKKQIKAHHKETTELTKTISQQLRKINTLEKEIEVMRSKQQQPPSAHSWGK